MADRILDEYQPLAFYKKHGAEKKTGFSKFEVDGKYYFCRYVDGKICMISQAYQGVAGRDNGIVSIRTNEKIKSRYRITERKGGKFGFSLRAGNHQEIAISPDYETEAAAEHVVGRLTGKVKAKRAAAKKPAPKKTTSKKTAAKAATATTAAAAFTAGDGRIENYKPLAFYEKHGGKGDGFNRFDQEGAYYFNYAQDGDVVLISESYASARGRDNGVKSVEKNMPTEARYQHHVHKNGKHYFDLNAANHQEIATSRWYDSETAALDGAKRLRGELPLKSVAAAAGAAGLAAGAAVAARAGNVEQDYKPLAFYQRQTEGREHGIEAFTGDDSKHYFAYFENDKIALISEGYPTKAARDTGVASVEKNIGIEKRYEFRGPLKNGKYEYRLKAGNHKEIARSVWYGSAAAAAAGAAYLMGTRKRVPAIVPKDSAPIAAVAAAPLAAAAVAGTASAAPVPDPEPVAVAPAPAPANDGEGGGMWGWLKWLLLALLALLAMFFLFKACAGGDADKASVTTPAAIETGTASAAPMITCWNGSEAETLAACPAKITCWNGDEVTDQSACPVEPAAEPAMAEPSAQAAPAAEAEPAPTVTCWDDSQAASYDDCPPVPEADPEPVAEPEPVIAPTPAPRSTFAPEAGATAGIFTAGVTPIVVNRLGTLPEFGDSRGLTPTEFYNKLNGRYQTNSFDRNYLDYLATELGYGGWSDITAADFTEATLANGTRGVLGFGTYHGYQYAEFDMTDPSHLDAFKIASRNGRTVYFMKRCGNYFFPT